MSIAYSPIPGAVALPGPSVVALPPERTVRDLFAAYLDRMARRGRSPASIRCYRSAYDRLDPEIGGMPVADLTLQHVVAVHERWSETPVLADRAVAYLSAALSHAERMGWRAMNSNFCARVDRYNVRRPRRTVSAQDLRSILVAVDDLVSAEEIDRVAASVIRLLVWTGCRLGEILTARWSDLDTEAGVFNFAKTKTGARRVAVPPEAMAELARIPRVPGVPWINPNTLSNGPRREIRLAWTKIQRRTGLKIRRHDLRHGFATTLIEDGVPIREVMELLGHTSTSTTDLYIEARVERLRGRMSDAMRREGGDA